MDKTNMKTFEFHIVGPRLGMTRNNMEYNLLTLVPALQVYDFGTNMFTVKLDGNHMIEVEGSIENKKLYLQLPEAMGKVLIEDKVSKDPMTSMFNSIMKEKLEWLAANPNRTASCYSDLQALKEFCAKANALPRKGLYEGMYRASEELTAAGFEFTRINSETVEVRFAKGWKLVPKHGEVQWAGLYDPTGTLRFDIFYKKYAMGAFIRRA